MKVFLISVILLLGHISLAKDDAIPTECTELFSNHKVRDKDNCTLACETLKIDMGTFYCAQYCTNYCSGIDLGFRLSDLYPGLTEAEKKFVDSNPKKAAQAYLLSWKAEKLCHRIYLKSDTNDESDACRHYVWAGLLNFELGQSDANQILDAHEQNPLEPETEKAMDLANNRRGIIVSSELQTKKTADEVILLDRFKSDLSNGKLIVLKGKKK